MNRRILVIIASIVILAAIGFGLWSFLRVSPPPAGSVERLAAERASSATATYALSDIAKHATSEDCWTAIGESVYDVTSFIPQHPGGRALIPACGTDGSSLFAMEPAHARENAMAVLDATYRIGSLRR